MSEQNGGSAKGDRDDLQSPLIHEGARAEQYDGNEAADDKVEVVEPDGRPSPRVPNLEGRSPEGDEPVAPSPPDRDDRSERSP